VIARADIITLGSIAQQMVALVARQKQISFFYFGVSRLTAEKEIIIMTR
jgi:hypothetical protein